MLEILQDLTGAAYLADPDALDPATRALLDAAHARFRELLGDVEPYRIQLVREGDTATVVFSDPESARRIPTYEVELAPDLAVRRASFARRGAPDPPDDDPPLDEPED